MRREKKLKLKIILFLTFSLCFFAENSSAEDTNNQPGEVKTMVEQELKIFELKKQNDNDEFKAMLSRKLKTAAEDWVDLTKKERDNQLDTVIPQGWDKQTRTAMILPTNNTYYLRGYKYDIIDSDIFKSQSINPTYKAVVLVKEELYVEKSHHSNISDIKLYLYTVTNTCTLNFIYRNDDFNLLGCDRKLESMVNEVSSEVRKEWLWQWL